MEHVAFYEDAAGEHRWALKAANGEIVATGEGHTSQRDAERAFVGAVDLGARVVARIREARTIPPEADGA